MTKLKEKGMKTYYKLSAAAVAAAAIVSSAPVLAQTSAGGVVTVVVPAAAKSSCAVGLSQTAPSLNLIRGSDGTYSWTTTDSSAAITITQGDLPSTEKIDVVVALKTAVIASKLNEYIDGEGGAAAITAAQLTLTGPAVANWTSTSAAAHESNTYSLTTLAGAATSTTVPFSINTTTLPISGIRMKHLNAQSVTVDGAYEVSCNVSSNGATSN